MKFVGTKVVPMINDMITKDHAALPPLTFQDPLPLALLLCYNSQDLTHCTVQEHVHFLDLHFPIPVQCQWPTALQNQPQPAMINQTEKMNHKSQQTPTEQSTR